MIELHTINELKKHHILKGEQTNIFDLENEDNEGVKTGQESNKLHLGLGTEQAN